MLHDGLGCMLVESLKEKSSDDTPLPQIFDDVGPCSCACTRCLRMFVSVTDTTSAGGVIPDVSVYHVDHSSRASVS